MIIKDIINGFNPYDLPVNHDRISLLVQKHMSTTKLWNNSPKTFIDIDSAMHDAPVFSKFRNAIITGNYETADKLFVEHMRNTNNEVFIRIEEEVIAFNIALQKKWRLLTEFIGLCV